MTDPLKIAVVQFNPLVGDPAGNARRMLEILGEMAESGIRLALFPEMTLSGYPLGDLVRHPGLGAQLDAAEQDLLAGMPDGLAVLYGRPVVTDRRLANRARLADGGAVVAEYDKRLLPSYGVFDECRWFTPGDGPVVAELDGFRLGLTICEDLWGPGPFEETVAAGAEVVLNLSASPWALGKGPERIDAYRERLAKAPAPLVSANLVGGQDRLVFDGTSLALGADGEVLFEAPPWESGWWRLSLERGARGVHIRGGQCHTAPDEPGMLYEGAVLATRDYLEKNRAPGVLVGLSGGIDSALTLAVAVDAVGSESVEAVMMPTAYTREISLRGAREQAESLGVAYRELDLDSAVAAVQGSVPGGFTGVAAENLQSRLRGLLLMGLSNESGWMVLATGNKSELAVGYATLYGDMVGAFAPLCDVTKTQVYAMARWRNDRSRVIPEEVIERPPSAELRADQYDSDSLPEYDQLDPLIEALVERDATLTELVSRGYPEDEVRRVAGMIQANEYKRRQGPPGPRLSRRGLVGDRRYPITNGYRPDST